MIDKQTDKQEVLKAVAAFLGQPVENLDNEAVLTDLVAQSFLLVEMVIELQEEFGVRFGQDELKYVRTVGDLTGLIETLAVR